MHPLRTMGLVPPTVLCLLSVVAPATHVVGEEVSGFKPAMFHDGGRSLQNRIAFPLGNEDIAVTISCEALVSEWGRFLENSCFLQDDALDTYVGAIRKAVGHTRITPAYIDGRRSRIWFQYTVEFVRSDGQTVIRAYEHHGRSIDRLGSDYTAPQRYDDPRYAHCAEFVGGSVWVSTTVDVAGLPRNAEVLTDGVSGNCRHALRRFIEQSRYVPAFHGGYPVEAISVEVFGSGGLRPLFSWRPRPPMRSSAVCGRARGVHEGFRDPERIVCGSAGR